MKGSRVSFDSCLWWAYPVILRTLALMKYEARSNPDCSKAQMSSLNSRPWKSCRSINGEDAGPRSNYIHHKEKLWNSQKSNPECRPTSDGVWLSPKEKILSNKDKMNKLHVHRKSTALRTHTNPRLCLSKLPLPHVLLIPPATLPHHLNWASSTKSEVNWPGPGLDLWSPDVRRVNYITPEGLTFLQTVTP